MGVNTRSGILLVLELLGFVFSLYCILVSSYLAPVSPQALKEGWQKTSFGQRLQTGEVLVPSSVLLLACYSVSDMHLGDAFLEDNICHLQTHS